MLGGIGGRRRRARQRMRWLNGITDSMDMSLSNPGIKPSSPILQAGSLPSKPPGKYSAARSSPQPLDLCLLSPTSSAYFAMRSAPSGLRWVWRNGRGPHLEGRQVPQASSAFRTPTAGSLLWRWRGPSGLRWVWRNGRGPHLEGRQVPRASSPFRTPTAGSLQSWDRRVRPRLV